MGTKNLIFIPLIFMFIFSIVSLFAFSGGTLGDGYSFSIGNNNPYFYDWTGRPLVFAENLTAVSEEGSVLGSQDWSADTSPIDPNTNYAVWDNGTIFTLGSPVYLMYYNPTGNSTGDEPILYEDYNNYRLQNSSSLNITGSISTSYGLIVLFIVLMAGITVAGIKIFGWGLSDLSLKVIAMGTALIAVWTVFSVLSLNLLAQIPYGLGAVLYLAFTLSYVLGLILNIGGGN